MESRPERQRFAPAEQLLFFPDWPEMAKSSNPPLKPAPKPSARQPSKPVSKSGRQPAKAAASAPATKVAGKSARSAPVTKSSKPAPRGEQTQMNLGGGDPIAEESVAATKKTGKIQERKGAKPVREAADPGSKVAAKANLSAEPEQPEEDAAVPEEAPTPEAATDFAKPVPAAPLNPVVELANTSKGCWKTVEDGTKSQLSDKEWRQELAHLLERPPALPS